LGASAFEVAQPYEVLKRRVKGEPK
jgi:hypothetical protein